MVKRKKFLFCALAVGACVAVACVLFYNQSTKLDNSASTMGIANNSEQSLYTQVTAKENVTSETLSQMPYDEDISSDLDGTAYESGKILVTFKEKAFDGENEITTTNAPLSDYAKRAIAKMVTVEESGATRVTDETASLTLRQGASVSQAVEEIKKSDAVENAQPNYKYTLAENSYEDLAEVMEAASTSATPSGFFDYTATNDPLASTQWYISNWSERIKDAWTEVKTNNQVGIAILDTGIDKDHEDLVDNIKEATNVVPDRYGWTDTDGEDIYGHGTNCAGIAAARSNNGIGMTGTSYNANILSVRVFQNTSEGITADTSSLMKGLEYAISKRNDYNIRIISMSLGIAGYSIDNPLPGDYNVFNLVDKAWDAGISTVVASGNDTKSGGSLQGASFPSYYEKCIAVGAIRKDGTRAYFSNGGRALDVVAPGYQTYSTKWSTTTSPTETDKYNYNQDWTTTSGTSFATPYVSGVIALMYAANPSLTPENVYNILTTTTDSSTAKFSDELGYGKVNPYYAVKEAKRLEGAKKTYRVFFDVNGGKFNDNVDLAQVVQTGDKAVTPSNVYKNSGTNQNLAGWYTDSTLQTKWDFSNPVTKDMTLYAKWTSDTCKHTTTIKKEDTPATCISTGKTGDTVCANCGEVTQAGTTIPINADNHTSLTQVAEKAATCTEEGHSAYKHCEGCNKDIDKTVTQATGHKPVSEADTASTCSTHGWSGKQVCSVCHVVTNPGTQLALDPNKHSNLVTVAAKLKTCTEDGYNEHQHCNDCDKDINKVVDKATGHNNVVQNTIEATCTSTGLSGKQICSVCNEVTFAGTILPINKSNHTHLVSIEAKAATCSSKGYNAHQHCNDCGEDVGKIETSVNSSNHVNLTHVAAKAATCTEDGHSEYDHCNDCNTDIGKKTINATGHKTVVQAQSKSTCSTHGWSGREVCSVCGTITKEGQELPLDPSNHSNLVNVEAKAATCIEGGYTAHQHCNDCNIDINKTNTPLDANNHVHKTHVAQKAATCTEDGHSEYDHCDDCGIDIGKSILNATGHDFYTIIDEATCTHTGTKTTKCKNCDYSLSEDIEKLAHNFKNGVCTVCGEKDPDYINPDPSPQPTPDPQPSTFALNISTGNGLTVTTDKSSYETGESAKLTIKGVTSGNNFIIASSVKVDGVVVKTKDQLLNKSTWTASNKIYLQVMNEASTIVNFDAVRDSLASGSTVEIANVDASTKIEVEALEIVPVYRLYNSITSEHMFTTNKAEYDNFVALSESRADYWIGEGINWFAPKSATTIVRRLYNPALGALGHSSHYYTSDQDEIDNLVNNLGWLDDGVENQFASSGDVPIWTCYNEALGSAHHYTSDKQEWQNLELHGWDLERAKNGVNGVFQGLVSAFD